MRVYLASTSDTKNHVTHLKTSKYLLESFYYFKPWQTVLITDKFMLDSGAFTFMNTKVNEVINWDKYVTDYAEFIVKHNIKLFFELDIDVVVGLKEVERLRAKLETITKRKCIPVWHKSRGKNYFLWMVKNYKYVAIGGIVTGEIKPSEFKHLTWFINTAHAHGCKIHGLGFTRLTMLNKYKFDSVDSTAWKSGRRFGKVYEYKKGELILHSRKNQRLSNYRVADFQNLIAWLKYQKYAEKHL